MVINQQDKLTGNTRLRLHKRWFREPLLVLQVEVYRTGTMLENYGSSVGSEDFNVTFWRDLRVTDNIQSGKFEPK